jgi:hypothetical protein
VSPVEPGPPWVRTDPQGYILDMCPAAERLFGLKRRGATARSIYLFFDVGRQNVMRGVRTAACGRSVTVATRFRPIQRKPFVVCIRIEPDSDAALPNLVWTIEPALPQSVPA